MIFSEGEFHHTAVLLLRFLHHGFAAPFPPPTHQPIPRRWRVGVSRHFDIKKWHSIFFVSFFDVQCKLDVRGGREIGNKIRNALRDPASRIFR